MRRPLAYARGTVPFTPTASIKLTEVLRERLDLIDLALTKPKIHRADDARDLLGTSHADDGSRHYAVSQNPRYGGLARAAAVAGGDLFQLVRDLQVARDERLLELRAAAAPIVLGQIGYSFASHRSGQQP